MTTTHYYNEETDEKVQLPTLWEICDYCNGDGYSTLHGMVIDPTDWDQEELDEYFHGTTYRTPCQNEDCIDGKMKVVNEAILGEDELRQWRQLQDGIAEARAEEAAERRMMGSW